VELGIPSPIQMTSSLTAKVRREHDGDLRGSTVGETPATVGGHAASWKAIPLSAGARQIDEILFGLVVRVPLPPAPDSASRRDQIPSDAAEGLSHFVLAASGDRTSVRRSLPAHSFFAVFDRRSLAAGLNRCSAP
jgi:hypothetical protein